MPDIVREVKTIFTADATGLRREVMKSRDELRRVGSEAERMDALWMKSGVDLEKEIGSIIGETRKMDDVWQKTGDSLVSEIDAILDETKAVPAAVQSAGESFQHAGHQAGFLGDRVQGMRKEMSGSLKPVDEMRKAWSFAKENALFLAGGIGILTSGVSAMVEEMTHGKAITEAFDKTLAGLSKSLSEAQKERQQFLIDAGLAPAQSTARERAQALRGDTTLPPGFGEGGEWQKFAEGAQTAQAEIDLIRDRARELGLELDADGRIVLDWSTQNVQALVEQEKLAAKLSEAMGVQKVAAAELEKIQAENAQLMRVQVDDAVRLAFHLNEAGQAAAIVFGEALGSGIKQDIEDTLGQAVMGAKAVLDPFVKGFTAGSTERSFVDWMSKGIDALGLGKDKPKPGRTGVSIDARGSKISVTVPKIETDDPARFADVSVKSAFIGLASRPLSATFGLGSPPMATGR